MIDKEAQLIWEAYSTVDINHSAEDILDLRTGAEDEIKMYKVPKNVDFMIFVFPYASTPSDLRKLDTGDVVSFNKCTTTAVWGNKKPDNIVACGDITAIVIGRNDDFNILNWDQIERLNQLGHLPCAPDDVKCTKPDWGPREDEPSFVFLKQLHN